MALIQCNFFSGTLGVRTSINVILPQEPCLNGEKLPVLYLLHGLSDDYTAWVRWTSIEKYAELRGLAVIMPDAGRSFYTDMKYGYKYETFISKELPKIAESFFPISGKREDTFIAGLSMGGYGALKLALLNPDRYCAAASLSGAVDVNGVLKADKAFEYEMVFGNRDEIKGTRHDLFHLAEALAASDVPRPKIYQCCGTEDFLYEDNIRFRDFISKLPFDYVYEEEHGAHEWSYWDKKIQNVLRWLPIDKSYAHVK